MSTEQNEVGTGGCSGHDEALDRVCERAIGHDGPHDALGEPEEVQPEPGLQIVQGGRVTSDSEPRIEEEHPTRVAVDLGALVSTPSLIQAPVAPVNLVDRFSEMVSLAVSNGALTAGEQVEYATAMTVVPGRQGEPVSMLAVTLFIPNVILGEKVHSTALLDNFFMDQDAVNDAVLRLVSMLIDARADHAEQVRAQQDRMRTAANGAIFPGPN